VSYKQNTLDSCIMRVERNKKNIVLGGNFVLLFFKHQTDYNTRFVAV